MLEAKLSKVLATIEDEPEPTLLWAMNSLVKLQALNCDILSRLLESRARYQTLVDSLLSACTSTPSSFQTELGYASYVTLGALTMAEVAHFSNADDKVIFLFKILHSRYTFNSRFFLYIIQVDQESLALPTVINQLCQQKTVSYKDLPLWLIQRTLLQSQHSTFYNRYLHEKVCMTCYIFSYLNSK